MPIIQKFLFEKKNYQDISACDWQNLTVTLFPDVFVDKKKNKQKKQALFHFYKATWAKSYIAEKLSIGKFSFLLRTIEVS